MREVTEATPGPRKCFACEDELCALDGCDNPARCGCTLEHPDPRVEPTRPVPQDRLPKQTPAKVVKFEDAAGQEWVLPAMTEAAAEAVPGRITAELLLDPSNESLNVQLAFHSLKACTTDSDGLWDALTSLPTGEMMGVIREWFTGE